MRRDSLIARVHATARVVWSHFSNLIRWRTPAPEPPKGERPKSRTQELLVERLKTYEEEIQRLQVENDQLRMSASAFGELAERLNQALRSAARVGRGRTPIPRGR